MAAVAEQSGGRLLDNGGYGCVFIPPLLCHPGTGRLSRPAVVRPREGQELDKITTIADGDKEFRIAEKIKTLPLWSNYFSVASAICTPASRSAQTDPDLDKCTILKKPDLSNYRLLRLKYSGIPIYRAPLDFRKNSFMDFVRHLLEAGALLTLFGIAHYDVHKGNIIVDGEGVPRLIDFNLSVDIGAVESDVALFNQLIHNYYPELFQEPPDSCLVNAVALGLDPKFVISDVVASDSVLRRIRAAVGGRAEKQLADLAEFYRTSRAAQKGNMVGWFWAYWRTIDSWSIGCNIVDLIMGLVHWREFVRGAEYQDMADRLIGVVRDMCQVNPKKRIDCVQALSRLDPENYIIRKYGGEWLAKLARAAGT